VCPLAANTDGNLDTYTDRGVYGYSDSYAGTNGNTHGHAYSHANTCPWC
jgi:hypothetical protein